MLALARDPLVAHFAPHVTGKPVSRLMPSFEGPRQCGQFSAKADAERIATKERSVIKMRIRKCSSKSWNDSSQVLEKATDAKMSEANLPHFAVDAPSQARSF
jgi:hypothetical protein